VIIVIPGRGEASSPESITTPALAACRIRGKMKKARWFL
jgi:hypothetical protein